MRTSRSQSSSEHRGQGPVPAAWWLRGVLLACILLGLTLGGMRLEAWRASAPGTLLAASETRPAVAAVPTLTSAPPSPTAPATGATAAPEPPAVPSATLSPTPLPTAHTPLAPTLWATPSPNPSAVITGTPTPVTAVPTAVAVFAPEDDVVNVLLLGSDERTPAGRWRTDTMIVVSIDRAASTVSLLSIPRDLLVYIPGHGMARINTADLRGGPDLVRQTLLYNLGIPIHYFARVNFDNFKAIVNAVGGVDVPVDCELHDWRLKSPELDPQLEENWAVYTQTVGIQHMDGDLALWYVRSRKTTNDFDRGRRQQKLLRAIYRTARDQQLLTRIPELWNAFQGTVETDLGLGDLVDMGTWAADNADNLRIRSFYLAGGVVNWVAPPDGAQVLLPDWTRIEPIIASVFTPPTTNRGGQDRIQIEVWNGSTRADMDRLAVDRLALEGYYPALGTPDRQDYPYTLLVDFTGQRKGSKIPRLREIFNVPANRVFTQVDPNSPFAYRVILGADYDPCRGAQEDSKYIRPTPTPTPTITPGPSPTPTPAP